MMDELRLYARPEVKAAIRTGSTIWLGTHGGLYRFEGESVRPVAGWEGAEIKALGPAPIGFYAVTKRAGQSSIARLDLEGRSVETLPPFPMSDPKCITGLKHVFAGAKDGIYLLNNGVWEKVYGAGKCEVVRIEEHETAVLAYFKKQGSENRPAVGVSSDGGKTWRIEWEGEYHDLVLAVTPQGAVTRWRHKVVPGEQAKQKKTPISAVHLASDGTLSVIDGHKLRIERPGHSTLEAKHPILAEAEILMPESGRALIAGGQGAYLLSLTSGAVQDLFAGVQIPDHAYKIKKLYALGGAAFLATGSFGSFRSMDGGETWEPVRSEWSVHDSEGLACTNEGLLLLACQRGVFSSVDGGLNWKHEKLEPKPHHFSELTSIAASQGMVAYGTKQGLYLAAVQSAKHMQHVEGLGRRRISQVLARQGGTFAVAAESREVFLVEGATGAVRKLGAVSPEAGSELAALFEEHGTLKVLGKNALYTVTEAGAQPEPLPAESHDWHAVSGGGRVVAWDKTRAWSRAWGSAEWQLIAQWPKEVKKAVLATDGSFVLATDRKEIHKLPVPLGQFAGSVQ